MGLKRILGGNRRPEPAEAPSPDRAADLLAKLALLDYGGFNADIVPWLNPAHGDFEALARAGLVRESAPGFWVVDSPAATAAKNKDVAAGVIDARIAHMAGVLESILEAQRRGTADVASVIEMMRHATSVFEAFGYISGRGLAQESVGPVGQIMIWTVLELQERAGPEQANELATTVINRFRTNIGEHDKHALSVAGALSSVHEDAEDWAQMADVLRWVCAGFARELGPDAEETVIAEQNLALAYMRLGDPAHAANHLSTALAGHLRSHAESHGQGPALLGDLARAYRAAGRTEEAIPYYVRAIAVLSEVSGDPSGTWQWLGIELIKAYREVGDDERADALYARLTAAHAKRSADDIDPGTAP